MKDIVERLLTENTMHSYYDSPAIQLDAAREITRLRARLRASETKIERLRAEIDGLEAELSLMKAGFEVAYRALGDKP